MLVQSFLRVPQCRLAAAAARLVRILPCPPRHPAGIPGPTPHVLPRAVPRSPSPPACRLHPPRERFPWDGVAAATRLCRHPRPGADLGVRRELFENFRAGAAGPAALAELQGGRWGGAAAPGGRRPGPGDSRPPPPPSDGPCPAALRPGPAAGREMAAGGSRGLLRLWLLAAAAGLAAGRAPSCHEVRTAFQLRQIGPLKLVPDVPTAGQYRPHRGAAARGGGGGCGRLAVLPESYSGPARRPAAVGALLPSARGRQPGAGGARRAARAVLYESQGEGEQRDGWAAAACRYFLLTVTGSLGLFFPPPSPLIPARFFRATSLLLLSS